LPRAPLERRIDGDPHGTIQALEEATEVTREIISEPAPEEGSPGQNEILEILSIAAQNLGVEYLREGRITETSASFQEALHASEQILQNIRSEPGFDDLDNNQKDTKTAMLQIGLDKSRMGAAYILLRLGHTQESVELYNDAIASRREIYDRRKSMLPLKSELAGHLKLYGKSMLWIDRPSAAAPLLQEAMSLWDELYEADPESVAFKRGLAESLYFMATLRQVQGHAAESLSLFERSRLLRSELHDVSPDEKNQINLMLSEASVGNNDKARELIDELGRTEAPNSEVHLERARALTQLSVKASTDEERSALQSEALTALETRCYRWLQRSVSRIRRSGT
jgi:tetratricopeptide (TPR) repeat protein